MSTDWSSLGRQLTGRLHLPGEPGYLANSAPFNQRYAHVRPGAVASVANLDDVRWALRWAREHGVPIVARSSGHSYGGYSVNTGLVLDLAGLNTVRVDPSTGLVTTAGGARMADVYAAIEPHGMAFALGNGPGVGIGGLVLGGGVAAASRKLGLTCDALVETVVVTADGQVLTCNATENADLFWACRGGGGGNFGINVSFTFQAQPVHEAATCLLTWDWSDAAVVLPALQQLVRDAPDEFSARLGVAVIGPPGGERRRVVSAVGQHLGPASELKELLSSVLSLATPLHQDIADRTFWEARDYLQHETSAQSYAVRTNFATDLLDDEALHTMLGHLDRWPGSSNADGAGVGMFAWGGEINRLPSTATAFRHRDAQFLISMDTSWTQDDSPDVVRANLEWLNELYEAMGQRLSGFAYQNFIDPDLDEWQHAYYGANYPRLQEVKRRVDPDGLFRFDQGITV